MGLFDEALRNLGLMFHHIGAEVRQGEAQEKTRQEAQAAAHVHSRKVEEESPAPGVIVRRTTVEEVILAPGTDPSILKPKNDPGPNHGP